MKEKLDFVQLILLGFCSFTAMVVLVFPFIVGAHYWLCVTSIPVILAGRKGNSIICELIMREEERRPTKELFEIE